MALSLKDLELIREIVAECIDNALNSEEEFDSINRIHDKLNSLCCDKRRDLQVELATQTLDKFDDYMKNVDKLNGMINEFKGAVSMARAALVQRKEGAS